MRAVPWSPSHRFSGWPKDNSGPPVPTNPELAALHLWSVLALSQWVILRVQIPALACGPAKVSIGYGGCRIGWNWIPFLAPNTLDAAGVPLLDPCFVHTLSAAGSTSALLSRNLEHTHDALQGGPASA